MTRRRKKNKRNNHLIPTLSIEDIRRVGDLKLTWHDAVHRSRNELFLLPSEHAAPTTVCIRSATDASIVWSYDPKGPRQSARAYTKDRRDTDAEHTRCVRVATQTRRNGNTYSTFVHPAIAAALLERRAHVPPGDVVARWNRAKACNDTKEAARLHAMLRDGLPICVYFN